MSALLLQDGEGLVRLRAAACSSYEGLGQERSLRPPKYTARHIHSTPAELPSSLVLLAVYED